MASLIGSCTREELKHLFMAGLSYKDISEKFDVTVAAVGRRFGKMRVYDSELDKVIIARNAQRVLISDDELVHLALSMGVYKICKEKNLWIQPVAKRVARLRKEYPELDAAIKSRQHVRREGTPQSRRRKSRVEFKDSVKKQAYERARGRCELCGRAVGCQWRQGTYHHIIEVRHGGLGGFR